MTHAELMAARKAYADKLDESEALWKAYTQACDECQAGRISRAQLEKTFADAQIADREKNKAWADLNTAYGKFWELEQ